MVCKYKVLLALSKVVRAAASPEFLQKADEVLLVVALRVLPVHIQTVKVVLSQERDCREDECLTGKSTE